MTLRNWANLMTSLRKSIFNPSNLGWWSCLEIQSGEDVLMAYFRGILDSFHLVMLGNHLKPVKTILNWLKPANQLIFFTLMEIITKMHALSNTQWDFLPISAKHHIVNSEIKTIKQISCLLSHLKMRSTLLPEPPLSFFPGMLFNCPGLFDRYNYCLCACVCICTEGRRNCMVQMAHQI